MSKWARRADGNQPAIIAALRDIGATVQPLHTVGSGVPDLLVAYGNRTFVMEIKDPSKPRSDRQLTPAQVKWHEMWIGEKHVVETPMQAIFWAKYGGIWLES
ncbi:hypothetical protein [Burkholderia sp. B21-007]|uniref:hypothetical protein n=1 Tax=Burkholderia sp. B21-007 TaxID=2890407 RepID=UPI001E515290|nr:hypothetical protein [Burkholderia sp. B21-007]UEP31593.1 hypothetical protein LMA01_20510 [Burkholderia sp. B21-007]